MNPLLIAGAVVAVLWYLSNRNTTPLPSDPAAAAYVSRAPTYDGGTIVAGVVGSLAHVATSTVPPPPPPPATSAWRFIGRPPTSAADAGALAPSQPTPPAGGWVGRPPTTPRPASMTTADTTALTYSAPPLALPAVVPAPAAPALVPILPMIRPAPAPIPALAIRSALSGFRRTL